MMALLLIAIIFQLSDPKASAQGGNVTVNLSAVLVQARCAPAQSWVNPTIDANGDWEINGTIPNVDGCSANSYANNASYGTWYGWVVPAPFACVQGINPNEPNKTEPNFFFEPVAISFFKTTSMYSMVFCYATLGEHDVAATLALGTQTNGISSVVDKGVIRSLGFGPNA
jgi:hypothetical protein